MTLKPKHAPYCRQAYGFSRPVRNALLTISACLVTAVFSGCGGTSDGRVPVSGDVKLSGQPLDRGSIEFHPQDPSGVLTGGMIVDGRFEIPADQGAKPGKYQVRVFASGESLAADPNVPPGPETESQVSSERVSAKFNVNSELEVEIGKSGSEDLLFEVSGP